MVKLRKKYNRYRTLKTICYFLGYPLLIAMVFLGSLAMYQGDAFKNTWYYGLLIVVVAWVAVIVLQLIFSLFCKNKQGRLFFGLVLSLVVVIGGAIALDVFGNKEVKNVQKKYEAYEVTIKDYKQQAQYYSRLTSDKKGLVDELNYDFDKFCEIYNVKLKSELKGSENADKSKITYLGGSQNQRLFKDIYKTLKFDYEKDVYVSENGMYADGYIFGAKQAIDILITYHETNAKFSEQGKNADAELAKAVLKAYDSSEWSYYTKSEEYKKAYGENGTAYNHMLTMEQLDEILKILGENVGNTISAVKNLGITFPGAIGMVINLLNEDLSVQKLVDTINGLKGSDILSVMDMAVTLPDDSEDLLFETIMPILQYISKSTTSLDFSSVELFKESFEAITVKQLLNSLDFDTTNKLLKSFNIDITAYENVFADGLSVDLIENLIKSLSLTSALFNYQSPTTKPIYEFITDEDLKAYGYASYYAKIHGSNIGSVLIGDNLGHVVMGDSGYPSSKGFTLNQLYQLRADMEYGTKLYPVLAARRYMYLLGGLIALMTALYYHNANKQDEIFEKIAGGAR